MSNSYSGSLDEAPEFINALLYGEPGSGKTTHGATMANMGRMYLVDVESGAKARALRRRGINTRNIIPVPVTCYQDLDNFYWDAKAELDSNPNSFVGVQFDSISEIHDLLIEQATGVRHAKAIRKAGANMEVEDDEFAVELAERGIVTEQLRRLSRHFRELPCHKVWVSLVKSEIDQQGSGGKVLRPALPPKFCNNLMGHVDVVGYCTRADGVDDESGFLGVFRETGMYRGKDRLGGVPPVLALPTFQRIHDLVLGDLDLEQDEVQRRYLDRVAARTPQPVPAKEKEAVPAPA